MQRFPEEAYSHLMGTLDGERNPESYSRLGCDDVKARRAELHAAGFSYREAQDRTFEECLARVLDHPLKHVLVSIPIGYRGINGDFFWIITVPACLLLSLSALRNRRWEYLWLVSPGLFGLVFHTALTDFYPRFIAPSIPALAISGALGLAALTRRLGAAPGSRTRSSFSTKPTCRGRRRASGAARECAGRRRS